MIYHIHSSALTRLAAVGLLPYPLTKERLARIVQRRQLISIIATGQRLPRGEALGNGREQILDGTGTRQTEADAPGIAPDHGPDLQELETNCADLGPRQLGAGQPQLPDDGNGAQGIGEPGQQQAKLIQPPVVA
jgi:hypothetical protein